MSAFLQSTTTYMYEPHSLPHDLQKVAEYAPSDEDFLVYVVQKPQPSMYEDLRRLHGDGVNLGLAFAVRRIYWRDEYWTLIVLQRQETCLICGDLFGHGSRRAVAFGFMSAHEACADEVAYEQSVDAQLYDHDYE